MIKAIVFDCFGVLLGQNTWDIYGLAGGDPQKDGRAIHELLQANNSGAITAAEYHERMGALLHMTGSAYAVLARKAEAPNDQLFDYIRTRLKPHYKIGLLSNANKGMARERFSSEQRALFDVVAISGEIGLLKPDKLAFKYVAEKLGVPFEEIVFVDDLARYTEPAAAMGMHAIQYKGFSAFEPEIEEILKDNT